MVVDAHVAVHVDVGVLFGFVDCSVEVEDKDVWCFLWMVGWKNVACCVARSVEHCDQVCRLWVCCQRCDSWALQCVNFGYCCAEFVRQVMLMKDFVE